MDDLIKEYSIKKVGENEKKALIYRWKKNIFRRTLGSVPMILVLAYVIYIVCKNIYYSIDNIFINLMCLILFLGWEMYALSTCLKEVIGYLQCKNRTWYQSIMYIDVTSSGKIQGKYYKDNKIYNGIIKYNYGELLRDLRMQYATLISFEGSSKLLAFNTVEWCEEVEKINQPRIKN